MNAFRLLGDSCHLAAILALLIRIFRQRCCTGISGKTQVLFALVYTTRYLDLFTNFVSVYNSVMKVVFITIAYTTLYLIYCRFRKSYESENDSFRFEILIIAAGALAFGINHEFSVMEIFWTFSIYLEAISIIPQLYMFYKTKDVSMFPGHYVFLMGSYRALYILNWIYRYYVEEYYDLIAVGAGVVQTLLFVDFFILYTLNKGNVRGEELQTVVV